MKIAGKVRGTDKDFTGILMIAASLAVIAMIFGILLIQRENESLANKRNVGVSLIKVLSNIPADELKDGTRFFPLMQNLLLAQTESGLQYIALTDQDGRIFHDITVAGVTTPPSSMDKDPSSWANAEKTNELGNGQKVLEYYGPIFKQGSLSGFVRIGFLNGNQWFGLRASQISFLGGIALPIFLLTPIFIILMRREIRRLTSVLPKLSLLPRETKSMALIPDSSLSKVANSIDSFINQTELRVKELEEGHFQALVVEKIKDFKIEKLESILNALPVGVVLIAESGHVEYVNNRFSTFLDIPPENILHENVEFWSQEPELQNFFAQFKLGATNVRQNQIDYQSKKSPEVSYQISSMPLFSSDEHNSVLGSLILIRDITIEAIEKNSGTEFVAHVTHELKAPLNVLAMYSETLLENGGRDEAIRTEAINVIFDQVERMTLLINNLLSVSQIESGVLKPKRSRTKLFDLLKDLYEGAIEISSAKALNLTIQVPQELSQVNIDKDLMSIALKNLLTNAIKYNRPNGSILLSAEEDDEVMMIKVTDTGLGIGQSDINHIFEKFYRSSDPEATSRGGHGLGLYLSKQIVALHYGHLSVRSELGVGSEFTITFDKTKTLLANAL